MIVAFTCIRTSIMCKCSKIGISPDSAWNVKSQQYAIIDFEGQINKPLLNQHQNFGLILMTEYNA